jgi:outer membrane protein OmpA-like peptidoglycan-associated protein
MTSHELSLEGVLTLNNIRFHKAKTNFVVYGFGGIGAMVFQTKVDALNASGAPYNFTTVPGGGYDQKKEIRNYLKDNLNIGDSYESDAEGEGEAQLFGMDLRPTLSGGVGMAFRLGKMVNLAIEDRVSLGFSDLLDGQRYQNAETGPSGRILSPNNDLTNFFSVGLNFNLGKKAIEPLWWQNPLDYAYNELNAPKHMKLPKPVLDDADGDGITDQFDNEPNTPANTPVDSHGVSRDTDGDGVPDSKDKELITPTQCQPVDADGVGTCPPPACCALIDSILKSRPAGCGIGDLPSVSFSGRSVALSNDAKAVLTSVADKMRNNPNCRVAVIGYGESSKSAQQLSWDRVNAVINHLVEKEGISTDRFIFKYGEGGGDPGTVDLREGTNDEGPNTVPAPHPNLRRKG